MDKVEISVVAFQAGDYWCAQGLQYDIAAQAKTLPDLRHAFEKAVIGHMVVSEELGIEPLVGLGPAPSEYWKLYEAAEMNVEARRRAPVRAPKRTWEMPDLGFRISGNSGCAEQLAYA